MTVNPQIGLQKARENAADSDGVAESVNDTWLGLDFPNLSDITTTGIYVIWHGGQTPRTVRVGQGIIRDRPGAISGMLP